MRKLSQFINIVAEMYISLGESIKNPWLPNRHRRTMERETFSRNMPAITISNGASSRVYSIKPLIRNYCF